MRVRPEDDIRVRIYSIDTEIKQQEVKREANKRLTIPQYQLLFYPKEFSQNNDLSSLDKFSLTQQQLFR